MSTDFANRGQGGIAGLTCVARFHITGLVHALHLPVLLNAEVIMLPAFTMPSSESLMCLLAYSHHPTNTLTVLQTVQDHQIEELLLVPPIVIRLVRDPVVSSYDLSCVKRFSSGAAPLSDEILQLLQKKYPNTGFKQGYGMTESCSCITAHAPSHYDYKYAHTVGTVCASTSVKIRKEDGTDGGVGEAGEILAKGPQCVMGYLDNEAATRETFDSEGWLHTGDQGMVDAEGVVHILDRIKEMIKVKGTAVAPAELEDLLLGHEVVEDCAVLGVPDEWSGEVPKAFVVLKDGARGKQAEEVGQQLLKYVSEKKIRPKWVKGVEFVDEIPKSASGKILRRVLKDRAKAGQGGVVVKAPAKAKL